MLLSDYIKTLQSILDNHGDIPCVEVIGSEIRDGERVTLFEPIKQAPGTAPFMDAWPSLGEYFGDVPLRFATHDDKKEPGQTWCCLIGRNHD